MDQRQFISNYTIIGKVKFEINAKISFKEMQL